MVKLMSPKKTATNVATVLVVDDELDIILALAECLESHIPGIRVFPAQTPAEALEFAREQHVDVVITDYRMPGLSGLDVLGVLNQGSHPPKGIVMTAYGDEGLAYRAATEGKASAFFHKPFDVGEMVKKVADLIQSAQSRHVSGSSAA